MSFGTPEASLVAAEERLHHDFAALVGGLVVPELVVPLPTNRRPVELERFSLVPLEGVAWPNAGSAWPANQQWTAPEGVHVANDHHNGGRTYLGAARGIGWTWDGNLMGIAAAGIKYGRLHISQLQGAFRAERSPELGKLLQHSGVNGPETLVGAWEQVARELGIDELGIRSMFEGTTGEEREVSIRLYKRYDGLAQDMGGFGWDPDTFTWVRPVAAPGQHPTVPATA